MTTAQSMRLIGRYFQGVISSRGLSPEASQDVVKVYPQRGRVVVADGAGETGGAAGEWAAMLAFCYGTAREIGQTSGLEWIDRAVLAWNQAANLSSSILRSGVNQQELALFKTGVDASFIGAAFVEREGKIFVNWAAAGDCEAFLFRDDYLLNCGPIRRWEDFTSTARSLNSKTPQVGNLIHDEWELKEDDVLILCSDALGQFILRLCGDGRHISSEVRSLMECTEWHDLRQWIEVWRQRCGLRNDDVGIVRVRILRGQGAGRFLLTRDRGAGESVATALRPPQHETPPMSRHSRHQKLPVADLPAAPIEAQNPSTKRAKNERAPLQAQWILLGLLLGALLPINRTWIWPMFSPVPEESLDGDGDGAVLPANVAPSSSSSAESPQATASPQANNYPRQPEQEVPLSDAQTASRERSAAISDPEEKGKERSAFESVPATSKPEEPSRARNSESSSIQEKELPTEQSTRPPIDSEASELNSVFEGGSASTDAPKHTELPQQEEVSSTVEDLITVETQPGQAGDGGEGTSEIVAQSQPLLPCILQQGTKLYGKPKGERIPLLHIQASRLVCAVDNSLPKDDRRVTLSVWYDAGPIGAVIPEWLNTDRIPNPTNVYSAPRGKPGSEYLGNVRPDTQFQVEKEEKWNNHVWFSLKMQAYRPAK